MLADWDDSSLVTFDWASPIVLTNIEQASEARLPREVRVIVNDVKCFPTVRALLLGVKRCREWYLDRVAYQVLTELMVCHVLDVSLLDVPPLIVSLAIGGGGSIESRPLQCLEGSWLRPAT
jgi:hypothetical protein